MSKRTDLLLVIAAGLMFLSFTQGGEAGAWMWRIGFLLLIGLAVRWVWRKTARWGYRPPQDRDGDR